MNQDLNDELTALAIKYGSDRQPWSKHSYTPYYYSLFRSRRNSIKKVLEIGVGEGRGLRMWRDFFPNAFVYGADNMQRRIFKDDRIEVIYCDQAKKDDLLNLIKKTGKDIDFVIDDGSHTPEDQIFTCKTLLPLLKRDTIYIIEDVADLTIADKLNEFKVVVPSLKRRRKRYDDNLVVVTKENINFSLFARRAFLSSDQSQEFEYTGDKPNGHLKRVSSIIRADQICEATYAKLNPISGYEQDVCIYVKPDIGPDFKFEGKSPYLDIVDGYYYVSTLKENPQVRAIVCSESDYFWFVGQGITNKIVLIPQHHCNFEREVRTRKEIASVGVIGTRQAFTYLPPELRLLLEARGLEFIEFSEFFTRQDIIDFYKRIDLQIVWRPYKKRLANPLKIVNAASFGIPTIALDETYFREMGNCYLGVNNFSEFLTALDRLRSSPKLYSAYSEMCLQKAENYHIDRIAKLYKDLA